MPLARTVDLPESEEKEKDMTDHITFIHISDLHWFSDWSKDQKIVAELLHDDIDLLVKSGERIDFVFFTGDLVQAGENDDDFLQADDDVIRPILSACGLARDRFIICPGNHDISRSIARSQEYLEVGMRGRLVNTEQVNRLVDNITQDSSDPQKIMGRMSAYERYRKEHSAVPIESTPFSTSHRVDVNGYQCGITAFNNAWRATGESGSVDRFSLILGERVVDEALPHLDGCDLRVALFHHPMNWMAEFDSASVKPRLFQNYDIILFGHVHEPEPEMRSTITGSSITLQSGSIFSGRSHFNGYQLVNVNPQTGQVNVKVRTYFDKPTRRWGAAENIAPAGLAQLSYKPKKKGVDPDVEKFMLMARPLIRRKALEQFNIADLGSKFEQDPHESFIVPPLYLVGESHSEMLSSDHTSAPQRVDLPDVIIKEVPISFNGPSGAGKTSLAHYCSVLIAEGVNSVQKIPVIVDARTFSANDYGVRKAIGEYLENGIDEKKALLNGRLVFLLDNFDRIQKEKRQRLLEYARKHSACGWLFFSTESPVLLNKVESQEGKIDGEISIRIGYLPRKSIRAMTKRWCGATGENAQETFQAIMRQLEARDLPRTGYIVTLLLWGMDKAQSDNRLNEAYLLSAISDFLLGKSDILTSQRTGVDSITKEHILQEISFFLRPLGGSTHINDLLQLLIQLFKDKALPYSASEILDGFTNCGILTVEAGQVRFKYTRFAEFYYAQRLKDRPTDLRRLMESSEFLAYSREIELMSGLRRENSDILQCIYNWLAIYPDPISQFSQDQFDQLASNDRYLGAGEKQLKDIRTKKLSASEIDDLMDETERELHKLTLDGSSPSSSSEAIERIVKVDISRTSPPLFMGEALLCLLLLGKVLKNSDFNSKEEKLKALEILADYHLRMSTLALEIFSEIFERFIAEHADQLELTEADQKVVTSIISQRFLLSGLTIGTDAGASRKILPLLPKLVQKFNSNLGVKLYINLLWMDSGGEGWHSAWRDLISDPTTPLLVKGVLADKLHDYIHQVPMTETERDEVIRLSWDIYRSQGTAPKLTLALKSIEKGRYIQMQKRKVSDAQASLSNEQHDK